MALSRIKVWIAAEVLTAADQNAEFQNIIDNALTLISPLTAALDADGKEIILDTDGDTSIHASTDDQIDIKISGSDDFKFTANLFDILSGSTLNINAGATHKVAGVQTLTKGADVTAATDLLVNIDGNIFDVAGATTIVTIASKGIGTVIKLHFDEPLTLTHDATNLILPGGANITTAAGDEAEFYEYASADWRCTDYTRVANAPGGGTREFFIYPAISISEVFPYSTVLGEHPIAVYGATGGVNFEFYIPNDFSSLTDAVVMVIPDASETIQWDVATTFGADGEAYNANTDTITDAQLAVTQNQIAECDVSAALTVIASGDYVGLSFEYDTDSLQCVGMRIRYS